MAKILLGIALAIILGAAVLGFMTKQKMDLLQGDLKRTKQTLAATQAELAKTKDTLKKTEEELVAAKATIVERDTEIAKQKSDIEGLNSKIAAMTADVEAKTAMIASLEAEKAAILKQLGDVKPEELAAKINDLNAQLSKAQTDLVEAKQIQESLQGKVTEGEAKLATTERTVQEYKTGFVRTGLSGRVLAFNPGWNFVVLSLGDKAGIKANAQMLVMRGGQQIGKVKVTSVEPATSIADVLPGSVQRGVTIQPGDTVVFDAKR